MTSNLLAPGAVLALWTLIMLGWVAATRFTAMARAGVDLRTVPPGGRGQDLERVLPPQINWKSHNYTHLVEQPTLFYAVIIFLHLAGSTSQSAIVLAWTYVSLRILHSIWQATVNRLTVRLAIFSLSSLCLLALTLLAVGATFA